MNSKKKKMSFLLIILVIIFVAALAVFCYKLYEYSTSAKAYRQASDIVSSGESIASAQQNDTGESTETPGEEMGTAEDVGEDAEPIPTYLESMATLDLKKLQDINSEAVGWISIPGTVVYYPLMQGDDNDKYLNYTYDLTRSSVGSIFLDYRAESNMSGFNTIIYGHRMNDGSMFSCLNDYRSQNFFEEHQYIYITVDAVAYKYQVFSAYIGSASIESACYNLQFGSDDEKQSFLDTICETSEIETGITPTISDRIITLSTCTGNGHINRMIVNGVLVDYYA